MAAASTSSAVGTWPARLDRSCPTSAQGAAIGAAGAGTGVAQPAAWYLLAFESTKKYDDCLRFIFTSILSFLAVVS